MFPRKIETPLHKVYLPEVVIPQSSLNLYRVLKDGEQIPPPQRAWLQDSGHMAIMLPAVNPMRTPNYNDVITDRSGEVRTKLPQRWLDFFASLNTADGARYLFAANSGLFNGGVDKGLEQLLMADNLVNILETRYSDGKWWGRVDTYSVNDAPPAAPDHRKQRFTIVRNDLMTITDTPVGPVYWVLVSHVPVWFPMDKLEKV